MFWLGLAIGLMIGVLVGGVMGIVVLGALVAAGEASERMGPGRE